MAASSLFQPMSAPFNELGSSPSLAESCLFQPMSAPFDELGSPPSLKKQTAGELAPPILRSKSFGELEEEELAISYPILGAMSTFQESEEEISTGRNEELAEHSLAQTSPPPVRRFSANLAASSVNDRDVNKTCFVGKHIRLKRAVLESKRGGEPVRFFIAVRAARERRRKTLDINLRLGSQFILDSIVLFKSMAQPSSKAQLVQEQGSVIENEVGLSRTIQPLSAPGPAEAPIAVKGRQPMKKRVSWNQEMEKTPCVKPDTGKALGTRF